MPYRDPKTPPQTKGERTRERLFAAAVRRFEADGYEAASLRRIAADADVTPALLYRYFDSKDAIVAELYGRLLGAWEKRAQDMPKGTWAERVLWLTREAFDVLASYRELLRVLVPAMVEGDATASPMRNDASKRIARPTFRRAVAEAKDAPKKKETQAYAELAYVGHLTLILFWVMDQSPEQCATRDALAQAADLAPFFKMGLKTPFIGKRLLVLGRTITVGLNPEAT